MEQISPTVYIETGYPGVNVGAIATDGGVVCIDAPSRPQDARDWLDKVRATIGGPIQYLILTDYQGERTLCGGMFHSRGVAHEETQSVLHNYAARFPGPIVENLALRHSLGRKELNGTPVIHPQVSFCEQATLRVGSHRIDLYHTPSATPGSLWVSINAEGVLFVGDTVVIGQHPPLAEAETTSWLAALERLEREETEAEIIVPGRGPKPDREGVTALRAFIETAQKRVCGLYAAGRPRAETSALVPELAEQFPVPPPRSEGTVEWLHRQLKAGLDHLYDECKAGAEN
jgi:glyoxylase-like metal-dependent hydrolase (beta-lactamase superfamily II)